jgi:predicted nucleotidyltransferase
MGTTRSALPDVLFSKTQRRVLGLLFGDPTRSYYTNEVVRFAGSGIGAVQRELENLSAAGLLTVTRIGNQKHYQANRESPIYSELRGIVLKTFGVADVLRGALAPLGDRIQLAFIYGSVAKGTDTASSDIDLMIISAQLSYPDVVVALEAAEQGLGRTINPSIYKPDEFRRKIAEDNAFLKRVTDQPRIFLIGSDDGLIEP